MTTGSYEDSYEQRTTLAWNRTALTFGAVPLVGAKLAFNTAPWLGLALTLLGIAAAVLLLVLAERRAARPVRAPAVLTLVTISMSVVLAGLVWTG
jgi:hypothetical protein